MYVGFPEFDLQIDIPDDRVKMRSFGKFSPETSETFAILSHCVFSDTFAR